MAVQMRRQLLVGQPELLRPHGVTGNLIGGEGHCHPLLIEGDRVAAPVCGNVLIVLPVAGLHGGFRRHVDLADDLVPDRVQKYLPVRCQNLRREELARHQVEVPGQQYRLGWAPPV